MLLCHPSDAFSPAVYTTTTLNKLKLSPKINNEGSQNHKSTYMPMDLLPPKENWEANSTHRLSRIEMQKAMTKVRRFVERRLEADLNVFEVRNIWQDTFCSRGAYGTIIFSLFAMHANIHWHFIICMQHTAPIAFTTGTGVNDELDGTESKSPVKFVVPNQYIPRGIKPKPTSELTPEEQAEANKYRMECEGMRCFPIESSESVLVQSCFLCTTPF